MVYPTGMSKIQRQEIAMAFNAGALSTMTIIREIAKIETEDNGYGVMITLKEHIFKQLCESRRKRAVEQFMEQVESLAQDVEELKNAVRR